MDKISTIKRRILQFIDFKGITKEEFYKKTEISSSNFKGKNLESEIGGEKIVKISIFKRDGKTISIIKSIDPVTEKVTSWINNQNTDCQKQKHTKAVSRIYENIKTSSTQAKKDDVARLIDNLYSNKLKFDVLRT